MFFDDIVNLRVQFYEGILLLLDEDEKEIIKDKNLFEIVTWIYFDPKKNNKILINRLLKIKKEIKVFNDMLIKKFKEEKEKVKEGKYKEWKGDL